MSVTKGISMIYKFHLTETKVRGERKFYGKEEISLAISADYIRGHRISRDRFAVMAGTE